MAPPPPAGALPILAPLAFIALALFRNSRPRSLKIEQLWIMPVVILVLIGLALSQQGMPSPVGLVADIAALAVGGALGWWRGRLTHITIDPATHALTSKSSPVGLILLLVVFGLRYGIRAYATANAKALHASVVEITDAFLVLAVGLMVVQRLEIWTRARKMLAQARAC